MPLSPSDVQYLNKLLDRRLKNRRSWPTTRYILLALAAIVMASAVGEFYAANMLTHNTFIGDGFPFDTPKSDAAKQMETQPVNGKLLDVSIDQAKSEARLASEMALVCFLLYLSALVQLWGAISISGMVIRRWNVHRQEAILITLLREKCAT